MIKTPLEARKASGALATRADQPYTRSPGTPDSYWA